MTPAVEIEAKLKSDAALKTIRELRESIKEGFAEASKDAKTSVTGLGKSMAQDFAHMISVVGIATAAFGALKAGVAAFVDFTRESINAAMEAEAAELRLTQALRLRGEHVAQTKASLVAFNSELERSTTLDADNLLGVEATLSNLGVLEKDLKSVTLAVVGFSEKYGKDLSESAQIVGKAIVENREGLRAFGLDVKNSTELVSLLAPAAQQSAEKLGTLEGRVTATKVAYGNLQETIGSIFTKSTVVNGAVSAMTTALRGLGSAAESSAGFFTKMVDGLGAMGKEVAIAMAPGGTFLQMVRVADDISGGRILPKADRAMDHATPIGPQPAVSTRNRKADEEALAAAKKAREAAEKEEETLTNKYIRAVSFDWRAELELQMNAASEAVNQRQQEEQAALNLLIKGDYDAELQALEAKRALKDTARQIEERDYALAEQERARDVVSLEKHRSDVKKILADEYEQKRAWGEMSIQLGTQMAAGLVTSLFSAALEGDKVNWGKMFGGLLSSIGQTAIMLGGIAIAAGALGTAVPLFAGLAGPAAVGLGLGLIAAGGLAVAAGQKLGSSGGAPTSTGSAGGFGAGAPGSSTSTPSFGTPRGFQPDAVDEPKQTVINVSFLGLMAGSERGLAREVTRLIRTGQSLVPGGG